MPYRIFRRKKIDEKNHSFGLDVYLLVVLVGAFITHYFRIFSPTIDSSIVVVLSYFATATVIWSALKIFKTKKISVDVLASIALIVSLIEKEWPSVLFINMMVASARIFADYTEVRSRKALNSLLKLKPQKAMVERGDYFQEVNLSEVKKGDIVLVKLGERIPVDGIIEKGEAEINQSSLTGESLPVLKKEGDKVLSSTIIESGTLTIKTEKVGRDTVLERVVDMVENSQMNKAQIDTLGDRFSFWYMTATLAGSVLLYVFTHNINLVLSILLVSCADDIAVATPLAFLASITHSAKHGVVVKGGDFLEALSKAKVFVFDKTGTLTRGKQKVEKFFIIDDVPENEAMQMAGAVSVKSSHPSGRAIINYLKEKKVSIKEPEEFEEYPGKGSMSISEGKKIFGGKVSYMEEAGVVFKKHQLEEINHYESDGFIVSLVCVDGKLLGFFILADEVRPDALGAITDLKDIGIKKIIMLTGDNEKIAKRVANSLGLTEFHANLLPENKLEYLKKYLSKKYKTVMVGDGVNDAANLSLADVGIAMGVMGTDAAIESADIALMKDDLHQLPELIRIGQSTMKVVQQNLFIWGIVNVVGLVLVFSGVLNPSGAAAYNFITDFFPLANSLRLFR